MKIYIDEAGRGPLAGPVYVGLVFCFDGKKKSYRKYLRDSKQLSENSREELYSQIQSDDHMIAITARKSAHYIERHGIVKALADAICQGLWKICLALKIKRSNPDLHVVIAPRDDKEVYSLGRLKSFLDQMRVELIIDGNRDFGLRKKLGITITTVVKGDSLHKEISAASICAKVERDHYMIKQAKKFPHYGFDRHKGYGTEHHRRMVKKYGLCKLHRKSWCH